MPPAAALPPRQLTAFDKLYALAISKQIKTVTWVIGIKTYAGV